MTKPTQKEIDQEIKKLQKMKPKVLAYSAFGDDHHAAIDAQIEMLKGELDDTTNEYYDLSDNIWSSADEARAWMDGWR